MSEFEGLKEHLFPRIEALGLMPAEIIVLKPSADVIDNPIKLAVRDARGKYMGVVQWSPPEVVQAVADAVRHEQAMRTKLGTNLGDVVLMAMLEGEFQSRSYAMYPWQRTFAKGRYLSRLHNWHHAKSILSWLSQVHAQMFAPLPESAYPSRVVEPLEKLRNEADVDSAVRDRLDETAQAVASGNFVPQVGPVHNDLWTGNILLPMSRSKQASGHWPFRLIDWGASRLEGFPFWDLLRIMPSLQLPKRVARKVLRRECDAMGMTLQQGRYCLLLACADLGTYRNEFPLDRYLGAVKQCHDYFNRLVD